MKAIEFKSQIRNRSIALPDNISPELKEDKEVRVIVLLPEDDYQEDQDFKTLSQEQFLKGYSDAVYDKE